MTRDEKLKLMKLLRDNQDELRVLLNTKRKVLGVFLDADDKIVIESSRIAT